jgi:hypothetical protein
MKPSVGAIPSAARGIVRGLIAGGIILLSTVFTNAGAAIVTNRIHHRRAPRPRISAGASAPRAQSTADTALGTESAPTTAGGRTVGTESRVTTSITNDTYQVVGTVTAGSTLAITEAGAVRRGQHRQLC